MVGPVPVLSASIAPLIRGFIYQQRLLIVKMLISSTANNDESIIEPATYR